VIDRTPRSHIRLAIVAGGVIGTAMRAGIAEVLPVTELPWATLTVNLTGALLLGLLLGAQHNTSATRLAFLGTGVLGSFTTFSTFVVEVLDLRAEPALAVLYAFVSVTAGLWLARRGMHLTSPEPA